MMNLKQSIQNMISNDIEKNFQCLLELLNYPKDQPISNEDFDFILQFNDGDRKESIIGIKKINNNDKDSMLSIHKKMWNKNELPISVFVLENDIIIYNNFTIREGKKIIDTLSSKVKEDNFFNTLHYDKIMNGLFWEKYNKLLTKKDRVDNKLLNNLRDTILKLHIQENMSISNANIFLSQCIFIKYLEDRHIITSNTYKKFECTNFNEILTNDKLKEFFGAIQKRFGGDLFPVEKEITPNSSQLKIIN